MKKLLLERPGRVVWEKDTDGMLWMRFYYTEGESEKLLFEGILRDGDILPTRPHGIAAMLYFYAECRHEMLKKLFPAKVIQKPVKRKVIKKKKARRRIR